VNLKVAFGSGTTIINVEFKSLVVEPRGRVDLIALQVNSGSEPEVYCSRSFAHPVLLLEFG
jgi:hypothetical protein